MSAGGGPVDVVPAVALAYEPADLVEAAAVRAVRARPGVRGGLDDARGVERAARLRAHHVEAAPLEVVVEVEVGWPGGRVPGRAQVVGVADGERAVARAHERLRGRGVRAR